MNAISPEISSFDIFDLLMLPVMIMGGIIFIIVCIGLYNLLGYWFRGGKESEDVLNQKMPKDRSQ